MQDLERTFGDFIKYRSLFLRSTYRGFHVLVRWPRFFNQPSTSGWPICAKGFGEAITAGPSCWPIQSNARSSELVRAADFGRVAGGCKRGSPTVGRSDSLPEPEPNPRPNSLLPCLPIVAIDNRPPFCLGVEGCDDSAAGELKEYGWRVSKMPKREEM